MVCETNRKSTLEAVLKKVIISDNLETGSATVSVQVRPTQTKSEATRNVFLEWVPTSWVWCQVKEVRNG